MNFSKKSSHNSTRSKQPSILFATKLKKKSKTAKTKFADGGDVHMQYSCGPTIASIDTRHRQTTEARHIER